MSNLSSFGFEGGNFKETMHLQESKARVTKIIISTLTPSLPLHLFLSRDHFNVNNLIQVNICQAIPTCCVWYQMLERTKQTRSSCGQLRNRQRRQSFKTLVYVWYTLGEESVEQGVPCNLSIKEHFPPKTVLTVTTKGRKCPSFKPRKSHHNLLKQR